MLTEEDVRALEKDPRQRPPVFSLYLNTDRRHTEGVSFLAPLRQLLKTADRLLRQRSSGDADAARARLHGTVVPHLLEFLEADVEPMPAIRAIAAFASLAPPPPPGDTALTTVTLPRPLRSQAHLDPRPYIRPLLFLLDQYERYAVIVADRKHARFFTVFLGEIEEHEDFFSNTPTRHDQGGWSQKRFQRHVDDHIAQHVHRVTDRAVQALRHLPTHRLLLGGDAKITHLIHERLPTELQRRVVATFPSDVRATLHEVLERTLAVAADVERAEEASQVARLREALAHLGRAVAGLPTTLEILTGRRALTLLVAKGFHAPGAVCQNCDALLATPGLCPHCRSAACAVDDIVEHAVEHAHRDHVGIEFVMENLDLESLGRIGAILRY